MYERTTYATNETINILVIILNCTHNCGSTCGFGFGIASTKRTPHESLLHGL